jgi:hypothetical protein
MAMSSCWTAASTVWTHDDPNPDPLPHRTYAELVGGPLDGLLLDIHGWRTEEVDDGVALSTELSRWPGGRRALYDPPAGEPRAQGPGVACRFYYCRRYTLTLVRTAGSPHRSGRCRLGHVSSAPIVVHPPSRSGAGE